MYIQQFNWNFTKVTNECIGLISSHRKHGSDLVGHDLCIVSLHLERQGNGTQSSFRWTLFEQYVFAKPHKELNLVYMWFRTLHFASMWPDSTASIVTSDEILKISPLACQSQKHLGHIIKNIQTCRVWFWFVVRFALEFEILACNVYHLMIISIIVLYQSNRIHDSCVWGDKKNEVYQSGWVQLATYLLENNIYNMYFEVDNRKCEFVDSS